ncbi:hypothetical protein MERGE_001335 [Pneumocystis wakefieldiae]|uniref:t-SNARE coiled-coil homology domain-containing protein n=1 Tax=Pneumocystis wakefieldiae TaxID=38082 RepID=A0A899G6P0_9ASCO|nr:hypothetical protein MERGE_001335 [Pneumocystis wakefieldiae]
MSSRTFQIRRVSRISLRKYGKRPADRAAASETAERDHRGADRLSAAAAGRDEGEDSAYSESGSGRHQNFGEEEQAVGTDSGFAEIVNPNMTQEEIHVALNDDQGMQVFSQALLRSNRHGEARIALQEVQERHQDIKKIEKTIMELAELFNEMSILIEQQDEPLQVISQQAEAVYTNIEQGVQHQEKAIENIRAARRKRCYCFGLVILILIAITIVIVIVKSLLKIGDKRGLSKDLTSCSSHIILNDGAMICEICA